jgi:hypothetical protein
LRGDFLFNKSLTACAGTKLLERPAGPRLKCQMLNDKWCLKTGAADNGNEPLLPWEKTGAALGLD